MVTIVRVSVFILCMHKGNTVDNEVLAENVKLMEFELLTGVDTIKGRLTITRKREVHFLQEEAPACGVLKIDTSHFNAKLDQDTLTAYRNLTKCKV